MVKVMVVDDERHYSEEVKEIFLGSKVYKICSECATAFIAIKAIERDKPDIILIDVLMPGMSGIELASRLKRINPLIKVILMSENPCFAVKGYEVGVEGFILKPLVKDKVLKAMERLAIAG